MKILVDCRSIHPTKSRGIENFAYSVIESSAEFVEEIAIDVCKSDLEFYKDYFKEYQNISFISDPVQGFFVSLSDRSGHLRIALRIFGRIARLLGFNPFGRRSGWAKKQWANVVFYPYHRDDPQHKHLPMVTTVHAILPEYSEVDMNIISQQMKNAAAIVTSWPHPYHDLSERYPFAKDRLFLVPFTAVQNVNVSKEYDIKQLGVHGDYYFYPAVITPRKNHINLIKACGCLKKKGVEPPLIVCSGGGDQVLAKELTKAANSLGVGEKFMFLGYVSTEAMTALYQNCKASVSASFWEAGIAAIQEGGLCGKPVICSDTKPAREHAKLFNMDVCFFDPHSPEDTAEKIIEFENNIDQYQESSIEASSFIRLIDEKYMGKCYSDVFRYVAGIASKPQWAPFLKPKNQGHCFHTGEVSTTKNRSTDEGL
ncbi:MAG: glycosyltransferase [Deltaproteobacteria bacterium]|jgi:glycosyltransferase involved in cell wall biosynthesis|nr:glycosyltransferase [Deltaproteobacteria bacterium]